MKTQITASVFWRLFVASQKTEEDIPVVEHLRHRCLLGFTALDAAIYTYWESNVVPEWNETLTLITSALDSPASPEILEELSSRGGQHLKKSQFVATLRFLSNTDEISRFTPNFMDLASYLLLKSPQREAGRDLIRLLCELQACRSAAVHTGRPWSEIQAHRSLKLIEECAEALCQLGQNFADAFGSSQLDETKKSFAA